MAACATAEGTQKFATRFAPRAAPGHFRAAQGLVVSSLGMGTYLGEPDTKTDESYAECATIAAQQGLNIFDSAINYRFQRSERSIRTALARLAAAGFAREEFVLCTKGGYLTPDGAMPADPNRYFFEQYIQPGIFNAKDIAAGGHCMTPRFLDDQMNRSLGNLGVECVDVYYLHNPETQLREIPWPEFLVRIRAAFEFLEKAAASGKIQFYGIATWNGLRQDARLRDSMQLGELAAAAKDIAGDKHRFRFVQLPFNLGMTEALTLGNQQSARGVRTVMETADELGITLIASASLHQGHVARNLPGFVAAALGLSNDAERALQFARSAPGITTALVGMANPAHARSNTALTAVLPPSEDQFSKLFTRGHSTE
jgi:aryl-alcohol dehydrogenase-like predicted oxidoreductase